MSAPVGATNGSLSLLFEAINASETALIKEILTNICQSSSEVATTVSEYLLLQKGELMSRVSEELRGNHIPQAIKSKHSRDEDEEDEDFAEEDEEDETSADEIEIDDQAPKRIKLFASRTGLDAEVISRYETCVLCKERFDILLNHPRACQTHKGHIEVNYDDDTWTDDIDVEAGYSIDAETDWRRDKFPEGFIWMCCEGIGNAKPCRITRHVTSDMYVDIMWFGYAHPEQK